MPSPVIINNVFNSRFFLGRSGAWSFTAQGGNAGPFGPGQGWINTNQFYGGALAQLRIGGVWHDCPHTPGRVPTRSLRLRKPHLYTTGSLVELYNGTPTPGRHGLVTVLNATQFTIPGSIPAPAGRCMGRGGYPHNDNSFHNTDIEDHPAMVFIPGSVQSHQRLPDGGKLVSLSVGPESLPEHCRGVQHHAWAHAFGWRGRRHDAPRLLEWQELLRLGETAQALGSVTELADKKISQLDAASSATGTQEFR